MAGSGVLVRILELAGQSYAQYGQCLCTNMLGEQEELIEAHAVGLIIVGEQTMREGIVPAVLVQRAVLHLSHAVFPLVARCKISTFHNATARETEHTGMQVFQIFHQVGAQPIPVVSREEADMVKVNALFRLEVDAHEAFGVGFRRFDGSRVFLPLVTLDGYAFLHQHLIVGTNQLDADFGISLCAGIHREMIVHAFLQSDAEEPMVLNTGEFLLVASIR